MSPHPAHDLTGGSRSGFRLCFGILASRPVQEEPFTLEPDVLTLEAEKGQVVRACIAPPD
jgi:hypothetical protein